MIAAAAARPANHGIPRIHFLLGDRTICFCQYAELDSFGKFYPATRNAGESFILCFKAQQFPAKHRQRPQPLASLRLHFRAQNAVGAQATQGSRFRGRSHARYPPDHNPVRQKGGVSGRLYRQPLWVANAWPVLAGEALDLRYSSVGAIYWVGQIAIAQNGSVT